MKKTKLLLAIATCFAANFITAQCPGGNPVIGSLTPTLQVITCTNNVIQPVIATAASPTSNITHSFIQNSSGQTTTFTSNPAVFAPQLGSYTYILTDAVNGCSVQSTFTVQASPGVPTFEVISTGTLASLGGFTVGCNMGFSNNHSMTVLSIVNASTTPSPGGAMTYSFLAPGGTLFSQSQMGVVSIPGTWTVAALSVSNNCALLMPIQIIQNTVAPNVSVSVPTQTLTCATPSTTLTGMSTNPMASYTWLTPMVGYSPTQTISVNTNTANPNSTFLYACTLTVTDMNNGCVSSTVVPMYQNILTDITGAVTNAAGSNSGTKVVLYKYSNIGQWDSLTSTTIVSGSGYYFSSVNAGQYIVKVIPTSTTMLDTYGASSVSWQGATIIQHTCLQNAVQNITLIPVTNVGSGSNSMSGQLIQGQGFGNKVVSSSLGGISIKGGIYPAGKIVSKTTTNANGEYTLSALPNSAAGENYFILVDVAGLDTNGTYHIILDGSANHEHLDFILDSVKITPAKLVGIKEISFAEEKMNVYPNPVGEVLNVDISTSLNVTEMKNGEAGMTIYDVLGKIMMNEKLKIENGSAQINVSELKSGIYFIKVETNNRPSVLRKFVKE